MSFLSRLTQRLAESKRDPPQTAEHPSPLIRFKPSPDGGGAVKYLVLESGPGGSPTSSAASRNFSLGKAIGEGRSAADLMKDRTTVAEGAHTAPVLLRLAREHAIDMPIVEAVNALLAGEVGVDDMLEAILARPARPETA